MPSDAYNRFVASLGLDYDRWHDGDGYDLEALARIDAAERGEVVHILAGRDATWRDVEALEHVDIPPARMAIARALRDSDSADTRLAAAEALDRMGTLDQPLDEIIAREIRSLGDLEDGCTRALLMAEEHPTEAVQRALLEASRAGTDCSMHCAGLLCYLAGAGEEPFDWNLRPLLLRLGPDESEAERAAAFTELCALVKRHPDGSPIT